MVINKTSKSRAQQQGVTLITVMIILIVVTLLGVSAMRMALSSLALATNSQVSNLLFQSADVGLVQFANAVKATPADTGNGVLVDAILGQGKEIAFCVTPKNGATNKLTKVNCNVADKANNFMSARSAVAVQVTVKIAEDKAVEAALMGTDPEAGIQLNPYKLVIYSTAVLPTFGSAAESAINNCLALKNDDRTDTVKATELVSVTDCLTDGGAVFNTQVDEASYGYDIKL